MITTKMIKESFLASGLTAATHTADCIKTVKERLM